MEFTTRRSDGFYLTAEEDKQLAEASKFPSSSSYVPPFPSSSASAAFRWHVGSSDTGTAVASGDGGDGRAESNFFSEKAHMFDKVVTPSDVGKLNRLVIPKQHAEKHFPLDPTANEKGLLLTFEDRTGKSWRFRYSYWNSSQSYVMTKGWSRFVKEKRLDAGDVVSFGRGIGEAARDLLYIDWKRRPENHELPRMPRLPLSMAARPLGAPWISAGSGGGSRFFIPPAAVYDHRHRLGFGYTAMNNPATTSGSQFLFFGSTMAGRQPLPPQQQQQHLGVQHGSGRGVPGAMVLNSLPLACIQAAPPKRVRLFGVNLDFPESEGNAAHLPSPSAAAAAPPQLQQSTSSTLPFLPLPYGGSFDDSSVASSSTSKEQHLTLDLDL